MQQRLDMLDLATAGEGLYEFTSKVLTLVRASGIRQGLLTLHCRHTSCSLLIQENADPDVMTDLRGFFARLVPQGMGWIVHDTEGPDDMPAHIRAALTQSSLSIPIMDGVPALGRWQGIYLFEHRTRPHRRQVAVHMLGEA